MNMGQFCSLGWCLSEKLTEQISGQVLQMVAEHCPAPTLTELSKNVQFSLPVPPHPKVTENLKKQDRFRTVSWIEPELT